MTTKGLAAGPFPDNWPGFLLIGASTGGPAALARLLPRFGPDFPAPILVCQHMTKGFTVTLADHLNRLCPLPVSEAKHGEEVTPGRIYIAPAGFQTRLQADTSIRFHIDEAPGVYLYRPCIDVTLESLVPIYQQRLLAVILTGMGRDGTEGCRQVKTGGGYVIVEAPESCVIYGMPRSVWQAGLADAQVPLEAIADHIEQCRHN
ncbi:CheB methylesterase domain-containing protein [Alicyclobacillus herbarius]|nr:CheB methylesterase domain-containing protein [Alicyclobacillus herbarius]